MRDKNKTETKVNDETEKKAKIGKERDRERKSKHIPHLIVFTTFLGLIFLISLFLRKCFVFLILII